MLIYKFAYISKQACMLKHAAPVENLGKCKTLGLAPVASQVQKLEGLVRQIISAKALHCQVQIFDIDPARQV